MCNRRDVMQDVPRQMLSDIIARYGHAVCEDPARCVGLLKDRCGAQHQVWQREIFVLVSALRERVAADLLAASEGLPTEALLTRLRQRLEDNLGLKAEIARWAVESWALALGKHLPYESPSPSKDITLHQTETTPAPRDTLPKERGQSSIGNYEIRRSAMYCPFCKEEILDGSIKCKYCKS